MRKFLFMSVISLLAFSSCKKGKIEKNLDGSWSLNGFYIDGVDQVSNNSTYSLEFANIDKGAGEEFFYSSNATSGTTVMTGTCALNDDYSRIHIVLAGAGSAYDWDLALEVDKAKIRMTGDGTSNGVVHTILMEGFQ